MGLALSTWIERGETVCFAGATGLGKTWLACALAQYACRQGHSALYLRVPRLAEELRILHGAGSFRRWLQRRMESTENRLQLTRDEQMRILTRLTDAVIFEEFIRKKFVGAKSFSLEGSESLIPLLDLAIERAIGR